MPNSQELTLAYKLETYETLLIQAKIQSSPDATKYPLLPLYHFRKNWEPITGRYSSETSLDST